MRQESDVGSTDLENSDIFSLRACGLAAAPVKVASTKLGVLANAG